MKNPENKAYIPQTVNEADGIWFGNRVPCEYFETKGTGESELTIHAGSYHIALHNAGIGDLKYHDLFIHLTR
jgi:hypothetical protein